MYQEIHSIQSSVSMWIHINLLNSSILKFYLQEKANLTSKLTLFYLSPDCQSFSTLKRSRINCFKLNSHSTVELNARKIRLIIVLKKMEKTLRYSWDSRISIRRLLHILKNFYVDKECFVGMNLGWPKKVLRWWNKVSWTNLFRSKPISLRIWNLLLWVSRRSWGQ